MKRKAVFSVLVIVVTLLLTALVPGCTPADQSNKRPAIESLSDLKGKPVAVITGAISDSIALKYIPDCQPEYANSAADLAIMLETGKVSAYVCDEPVVRMLTKSYPNHKVLDTLQSEQYGYIFQKGSERGTTLCAQMSEYLDRIKADGTLEQLDKIWFGEDEAAKVIDYSGLTAENGVLDFALTTTVGAPFAYIKNNLYAGYDLDIAVHFCREYGYGINFFDSDAAGMLASVSSGKCDIGGSCITITAERKESMLFSAPNYNGGCQVVIRSVPQTKAASFFPSVVESFEKTFIQEDRWELFAWGIATTVLLSLLSIIGGTLLGFGIYLLCRKDGPVSRILSEIFIQIFEKTPVVVILMILYYVILGNKNISSLWVSVIGFTLLFACSVLKLIRGGVATVDRGQREAAFALGYTDRQTFMKVVLPQAIIHIMPGYNSAVVSLIKDTAIVGYIAVQDLTKVSDIIRSRTYEAFFPIIASAVIYFLIAWGFTLLIRRIGVAVRNRQRRAKRFLKGGDEK